MKIFKSFEDLLPLSPPIILTIGNFDGVHKGHQSLFQWMNRAKKNGTSVILTFSNHPYSFFFPDSPVQRLSTLEHKLFLFESFGIDAVILFPFSAEIAKQSYETFLSNIHQKIPFSHLVLGKGSALGQGRQGKEEQIKALSSKLGFIAEYKNNVMIENKIISSGYVRSLIEEGSLNEAANFLGRPFSYYKKKEGPLKSTPKIRQHLKVEEKEFISPPSGFYEVELITKQQLKPAIASVQNSNNNLTFDLHFHGFWENDLLEVRFPFPPLENPPSIESLLEKFENSFL